MFPERQGKERHILDISKEIRISKKTRERNLLIQFEVKPLVDLHLSQLFCGAGLTVTVTVLTQSIIYH